MSRVRKTVSDFLLKPSNKRVILVVTVTVIATELFIVTDIGPFRFSIGTVVFVYAVLSIKNFLIIPTAFLAAVSVFLLRIGLDYFFWLPREYFTFMMAHQYSGFIYFILLSLILKMSKIKTMASGFTAPLLLSLGGAVAVSTLAEALVRVPWGEVLSFDSLIILIIMSAAQVFLVASFINISQFQKIALVDEQQRDNYEKMLILASDLYDELFYMQKSMENMENIMAKSYNLHKILKKIKLPDLSLVHEALRIAEEVHEVKKDIARILAGLEKVIGAKKERSVMNLSELLDLVVRANRNYSLSIDKKIQFNLLIEKDFEVAEVYPLLAIINNLVSNAVEAISKEGSINLKAKCRKNILCVSIYDDGIPIREEDRNLIFEPGFTTKFSPEGIPSTGIGLAYVRGLVENYRGRVFLRSIKKGKSFMVLIPIASISGV